MSYPDEDRRDIVAASTWPRHWRGLLPLAACMAVIGAVVFVVAILGVDPGRAWQAYLVNFVFWTGLAAGAVLFSAILSITHASWGRPLKRLAEAPGAFLPLALPLFLVLYGGREQIFPWIAHPIPEKARWLNVPFLFLRDGIGILALTAVAVALIYLSVRRETTGPTRGPRKSDGVRAGTGDREEPVVTVFANIYAILYTLVLSLIAFDLIMSLSPHWYSTLFGAYYFVGSFFTGLAALMILAALGVKNMGLGNWIRPLQLHNLGKLMLGFTLMTGDFFYTQFLVIWYGNLPEETGFMILRTQFQPWKTLSWTVLAVCFIFPFLVLLRRRIKMQPMAMLVLSTVILVGMWLERFLLVVPSLWQGQTLPLGLIELLISMGFFGIMAMCVLLFLRKYPMLPFADPLLRLDDSAPETGKEVQG
jgi:Ni/Fe-hydrogenase subunit HybB-like protein